MLAALRISKVGPQLQGSIVISGGDAFTLAQQSSTNDILSQSTASSLQSTLTGDGKQPAHNPQRVEQACTIYCKSKAGDWYSPQLELSRWEKKYNSIPCLI